VFVWGGEGGGEGSTFNDINLPIMWPIWSYSPYLIPSIPHFQPTRQKLTSRPRPANPTSHVRDIRNEKPMCPSLPAAYSNTVPPGSVGVEVGSMVDAYVYWGVVVAEYQIISSCYRAAHVAVIRISTKQKR
jgi:hypothetical protein